MNKYRAYDKLEKQMRRVVSLHWQNDTLVAVKVEGEAEPLPIEGRFIIEQYTGLKDKNGKEIYKGDILYCVNISFNGVYTDSMVVEESCACNFSHFGEIEIIGNIHENAELLEEKS